MPAIQQRRNKLSNKLWEQIQLAKSQMEHTHFVIKRRVTVKDLEGNYKSIERPKRIKPWWFMAADGALCLSVFYGSKRLELVPGKTFVSVKNMNDLIKTLELLKSETEAGSLDRAIKNASGALKLNFNKK
ncbi:hypothetical protein A8O14_09220 [Polynucleobacter wuianus]|uniref:Uncharacterized protein n=2 Tax=Polynucleobacter wuianus TaxID=1743168 RepID=A0A191UGV2_9BURK|nr:DUF6641 family protein [Polynucleobacter sp. MWH-Post4-6-1]ANJ00244.1 hypothetical protein A8O14_09220 [Polynucleobacter wuianus]